MIRALGALLALAAGLSAAGADWSYAPLVTYEDEAATLVLAPAAPGDGWRLVAGPAGAQPVLRDDQLILSIAPAGSDRLRVEAPGGRACELRFLAPGAAAALTLDALGRPTVEGARAVLVLSRIEARADRRWGLLRNADTAPKPCALVVPMPDVAEGIPALTAQLLASQALAVAGQGVLVELSPADRLAGWKHREYRQALAWLVADLQARGAAHIALAPPVASRARDEELRALRRQVADVATAYRCRVVEGLDALADPRLWEVAPGVLGTTLNAAGAERRAALLAPWRAR